MANPRTRVGRALRAAAERCRDYVKTGKATHLSQRVCISNELAFDNDPMRHRITDAQIERAAKANIKALAMRGLAGAHRARARAHNKGLATFARFNRKLRRR